VHNFAEGLAIGVSARTGAISLATVLVIGFALHNATEGFGIVGPLGDVTPSWRWLRLAGRSPGRQPVADKDACSGIGRCIMGQLIRSAPVGARATGGRSSIEYAAQGGSGMQRSEKRSTATGGRSTEELLQTDAQSLRTPVRHPITRPEVVASDPPAEDSPYQGAGATWRGDAMSPDARTLEKVAGELIREIGELQDRVASRFAAEEAEQARGGRFRALVARAHRRG
jgi:hypothetical protein